MQESLRTVAMYMLVSIAAMTSLQLGNLRPTPWQACNAAQRTDECIEIAIDGEQLFIVGRGAEQVLDMLGDVK